MKKRILSLAMALALCLGLMAVPTFAASRDFTIVNGVLTRYTGKGGDVIIPSGVTKIGDHAFNADGSLQITSITIPNSVTSIGQDAFTACHSMTSITIPDSVTSIGDRAFFSCWALTSVAIPDSVTSIGEEVFANCTSLSSATLSSNITNLKGTFYNCQSLTSVSIPDSVTSIGATTFSRCSGLTSVVIPYSVISIERNAFQGCTSLSSVVIPSSVVDIGEFAFTGCSSLTSVVIPDGVISIGNSAFNGCTNLTDITIPDSVKNIGRNAFIACSSLTSATIPYGVVCIEGGVFSRCSNLTRVSIPSSVASIDESAFRDCSALSDIYFVGTKEQWNAIPVANYNDPLKSATIHFVDTPPVIDPTPTPDPVIPAADPNTTNAGSHVDTWAQGSINAAEAAGLVPSWLNGTDLTQSITRADFAATALALYRAMGGDTSIEVTGSFTDVTSDMPAYRDILLAKELKIVSGVGDGTFDPNGTLTREAAAVMLCNVYKALGHSIPDVSATNFADNGEFSTWARSAVAFMNQNKIVNGKGDNRFDPQGINARQEAITMALNMLNTLD